MNLKERETEREREKYPIVTCKIGTYLSLLLENNRVPIIKKNQSLQFFYISKRIYFYYYMCISPEIVNFTMVVFFIPLSKLR